MNASAEVRCPTCKQRGNWFSTPFGPFCSKRCKLVDLGKWLNEEHAISEPLRPDHFVEYADLEPGESSDRPKPGEKG